MKTLPIDVVPNTRPQRFKWQWTSDTPLGPKTVVCEGAMPPSAEAAVAALVAMVRRQEEEVARLIEERDSANRRANAAETLNSNQRQMLDEAAQAKPVNASTGKRKG